LFHTVRKQRPFLRAESDTCARCRDAGRVIKAFAADLGVIMAFDAVHETRSLATPGITSEGW